MIRYITEQMELAADTPEHLADLHAIAANGPWGTENPVSTALAQVAVERVRKRRMAAVERAGELYQIDLDTYRRHVASGAPGTALQYPQDEPYMEIPLWFVGPHGERL